MRLLKTLTLTLSSLSLVVACSGEDSLGKKSSNQNGVGGSAGTGGGAGACATPNPAEGCSAGSCPTGYVCDTSACRPSSCSCDPKDGWVCTADCGQGGACVLEKTNKCEGPDPSAPCDAKECEKTPGFACQPDNCKPSTCSCGDNGWQCTADCGQGTSCRKVEKCTGPDPSAPCDPVECSKSQGFACQPDNCKPSICSCGPNGWECTADCGQGTSCVEITQCQGPDPSVDCKPGGCEPGYSCEADACKPSSCGCTKQGWVCDTSCGSGFSCIKK